MSAQLRIWMFIVIASAGLSGCFGTFFGTTLPENLRVRGVAANATVLAVWDTGWTVNDDPVIGMRVKVLPDDRAPFEAEIKRFIISRLEVGVYRPGISIRVRFDPADLTSVAVDTTDSGNPSGLSADDERRIHSDAVVALSEHYEVPPVPPSMHGIKVFIDEKIVGDSPAGETNEQLKDACRHSALTLFDRVEWWLVHDAAERHDLVIHADCTASVRMITIQGATFVLMPLESDGMRIERTNGDLVVQLKPIARTLRCPDTDETKCQAIVKDYAAAELIDQIVHSSELQAFAQNLGRGS
jgi:hypothetical protein